MSNTQNNQSLTGKKGKVGDIDRIVSQRLRMRRLMLGLSQQDLGGAADVSIQQVQKYENGTNRIASGKLYKFAEYLKVPVSYFFDKEEEDFLDAVADNGNNHLDAEALNEKEAVALVKAYAEIKDMKTRKKVLELIRSMS